MENSGIVSVSSENALLRSLQKLLKDSNEALLQGIADDERFLRPFLVGRKLNVKHAFETIKGYMTARYIRHPKVFQMKPKSVRHVLESGFIGLLRHRDDNGRVIGFIRCRFEPDEGIRIVAESLFNKLLK